MYPRFAHSKALTKAETQGPAPSVAGRVLPGAGVRSRGLKWLLSKARRVLADPAWGLAKTTEIAGSDDVVTSTLAVCQGLWVP